MDGERYYLNDDRYKNIRKAFTSRIVSLDDFMFVRDEIKNGNAVKTFTLFDSPTAARAVAARNSMFSPNNTFSPTSPTTPVTPTALGKDRLVLHALQTALRSLGLPPSADEDSIINAIAGVLIPN